MDDVVSKLEAVLLPEFDRRRSLIDQDARYINARVVSIRHAEIAHTVALACHPRGASSEEDEYSILVNITAVAGVRARGFVEWSQPFTLGKLRGYRVCEAATRAISLDSEKAFGEFVTELPALLRSFDRGLRRGCPPSTLRRFWHRLTRRIED